MNLSEIVDRSNSDPALAVERFSNLKLKILSDQNLDKIFINLTLEREQSFKNKSPLNGLFFTVKDNITVANHSSTLGSSKLQLSKSNIDASIIRYLEELGASLLGSTCMDDYALGYYGESSLTGRFDNSLEHGKIFGGSSIGSAITVAKRFCDFSLGTDTGGSVRIPAIANNIPAIKLTSDSLPREGTYFIDHHLDTFGLFADQLENLAWLCQHILSNQKNVGFINKNFNICQPDPFDLKICHENILINFNDLCARISNEHQLDIFKGQIGFEEALSIRKILISKAFQQFAASNEINNDYLSKEGLALIKLAQSLDQSSVSLALQSAEELRESITSILYEKLLLTPAMPGFLPNWKDLDQGMHPTYPLNYFMVIANICDLPALVFPILKGNLTSNYQLIGPPNSEIWLCKTALLIQEIASRA